MVKNYDENGIDGFFTNDMDKESFQNFVCVFGKTSIPQNSYKMVRDHLDDGSKSPLDEFPPGALGCTCFCLLNNIEKWDETRNARSSDKGGKWTKGAKGGGAKENW